MIFLICLKWGTFALYDTFEFIMKGTNEWAQNASCTWQWLI